MSRVKGFDLVCGAVDALKRQGSGVEFRVAGVRHDVPLTQMECVDEDLGVLDLSDVPSFWAQVDAFVLLSRWVEGLPFVLLEGLGGGLCHGGAPWQLNGNAPAHDDADLARIIRSCSLVNADGQAVVWASRLLRRLVPERVAGIDFMLALWRSAARNGYRVYLLGAEAAVAEETACIATGQGVEVVGHRDGYWDERKEPQVVAGVREARPDILFLAVPSPRKEYFLARRQKELGCALVVGVGGSFDVVAGLRSRAPRWMQRTGLEWFHRLAQEPRRMFLRYAVGNTRFVALTAVHWARLRTGRSRDA
ncbi:WecB/TagA/CpsF family glycosyltransferase [Streptomyces mirabilis]|uniref:WecB/TagA/CpsF family glycosyltransferase n=1 Tax=Streptomyces mirabilis TaxID=68239 RepID=UPI0033219411